MDSIVDINPWPRRRLLPLLPVLVLGIGVGWFAFHHAALGQDAPPAEPKTEPLPAIRKPWKRAGSKPAATQPSTGSASAEPALDVPPGQWTDLLKLVDVKKHAKGGAWKRGDAQLEVASVDSPARLMIPIAPKGAYSLKVEFTRTADGMVGVVLPVGSRQCLAALDYQAGTSGLDTISGRRADDNSSTCRGALVNHRRYAMEASVRVDGSQAAVTVTLDDRPFLFYRGPSNALALAKEWSLPNRVSLGLAAQSDAIIHSVQLRTNERIGKIGRSEDR